AGLAHPVYAQVRGSEWTQGDLILQSFWKQCFDLLPYGLLLTGGGALFDSQPRRMVLWFVAAFLTYLFCGQQYQRAAHLSRQAITVGELRDRIFDLAESAKVKMREVYLLTVGNGRLANAFAMHNNAILLTGYLLENMSKGEIDAIVGHELIHLKKE